jgi:stage II sporulation protein D
VPRSWTVIGGGYGDGVGMGAWGAYGYGLHGFSARAILTHFFTGTQVKALPVEPEVRVLLAVTGGGVRFSGATSACRVRLRPAASYRAVLAGPRIELHSASGRWLAHCGSRLLARSAGVVRIAGVGDYRGSLSLTRAEAGSLNIINQLPLNAYVRGSLPGEIPPSWPRETLRAFAIAIRSVAVTTNVGGNGYQLYSDTRTQEYPGLRAETPQTDAAVAATGDEVVTYRGTPVVTPYCASDGGRTESHFLGGPTEPWLKSVEDPFDVLSPYHHWVVHFSERRIDALLAPWLRGRLLRIEVTSRSPAGRVEAARLVGTRGRSAIGGGELEYALGLMERLAYFRRR